LQDLREEVDRMQALKRPAGTRASER